MTHILLAIRQRWADMIIDGAKTCELRRGRRAWAPGDWLWLYAVAPVQRVVGVVLVSAVQTGPAHRLEGMRGAMALSVHEFWRYAGERSNLLTGAWLVYPRRLAEPRAPEALGVPAPPRSAVTLAPPAVERLTADAAVQAHRAALDALSARLAREAAR